MSAFDKAWVVLKELKQGDRPDKRCLECGGIIPEEGGGPYDASNLCDCELPFDTSEEWDIDREPTRNTWHPDFYQDPNEEGQ